MPVLSCGLDRFDESVEHAGNAVGKAGHRVIFELVSQITTENEVIAQLFE